MNISKEQLADVMKLNPDLTISDGEFGTSTKVNKYHVAKPEERTYNGRLYPSKKQAQEAQCLDLEKLHGYIKGYIEEVAFRLPGGASHRVDFGIIELDDRVTWREVKGKDLAMGKLKRKQVCEIYNIHIEVV